MKMGERILVTGGAGFIGANLCRRLIGGGAYVVCLDNLQTGSWDSLADIHRHPAFRFIRHDVMDPFPAGLERMDRIFNLACPASPPRYQADKERTLLTNVLGGKHVLDFAAASSPGAVVFQASTSEVYGDPDLSPQPESYVGRVNPIGPRACYDEGKRAAETLFLAHGEKYGTDVRIGRIFNTYGPGMDPEDGRVVSNFIMQALREEPLTVYGDGSQTRSFCYVDDLVDAIVAFAVLAAPPAPGPVNLGNPGEFTIMELAELVLAITGSRSGTRRLPLPPDDPKQRKPDIALAEKLFGWRPRVALREGLEKTIAYFRRLA